MNSEKRRELLARRRRRLVKGDVVSYSVSVPTGLPDHEQLVFARKAIERAEEKDGMIRVTHMLRVGEAGPGNPGHTLYSCGMELLP